MTLQCTVEGEVRALLLGQIILGHGEYSLPQGGGGIKAELISSMVCLVCDL